MNGISGNCIPSATEAAGLRQAGLDIVLYLGAKRYIWCIKSLWTGGAQSGMKASSTPHILEDMRFPLAEQNMQSLNPFKAVRRLVDTDATSEEMGEVAVGDRFQSIEKQPAIWMVERIATLSWSRYPLVIMHREGRPDLKKTISLAELGKGTHFRRTL
ncbi:hypothetical protein [Eilatimonas milleporae]|nr:hypothetical protein [Eilatimonas milleporae]